jgi:hypothetical protein
MKFNICFSLPLRYIQWEDWNIFIDFFITFFKSGVIPENEIRKSEATFSWFRNLFFVFVCTEKLQTMHLISGNVSIPVLCSNYSPN